MGASKNACVALTVSLILCTLCYAVAALGNIIFQLKCALSEAKGMQGYGQIINCIAGL